MCELGDTVKCDIYTQLLGGMPPRFISSKAPPTVAVMLSPLMEMAHFRAQILDAVHEMSGVHRRIRGIYAVENGGNGIARIGGAWGMTIEEAFEVYADRFALLKCKWVFKDRPRFAIDFYSVRSECERDKQVSWRAVQRATRKTRWTRGPHNDANEAVSLNQNPSRFGLGTLDSVENVLTSVGKWNSLPTPIVSNRLDSSLQRRFLGFDATEEHRTAAAGRGPRYNSYDRSGPSCNPGVWGLSTWQRKKKKDSSGSTKLPHIGEFRSFGERTYMIPRYRRPNLPSVGVMVVL
mmetsp:Transcript_23002/g.53755  ORF Transcript_23002/g.53755 Transcript_23002/m.53755 type:complete len:292 (+) Transcript_23002:107-982(+)